MTTCNCYRDNSQLPRQPPMTQVNQVSQSTQIYCTTWTRIKFSMCSGRIFHQSMWHTIWAQLVDKRVVCRYVDIVHCGTSFNGHSCHLQGCRIGPIATAAIVTDCSYHGNSYYGWCGYGYRMWQVYNKLHRVISLDTCCKSSIHPKVPYSFRYRK